MRTPRMGCGFPRDGVGNTLEWDGLELGWDWDPDWFTPPPLQKKNKKKTNKAENMVFTKNL